jgi:hypothetical protein
VLRQIVGDLKPKRFARDVEVAFGPHTWVIVESAKSNSEFRGAFRAVHNGRTAYAAKSAMKPGRRFEVLNQILSLDPSEILDTDTGAAAKRGAVSLSAP